MDLAHALQDHPVALWAAEDEPGPLLDVHDGPMYADVEGPSGPLDALDGPYCLLGQFLRGREVDLRPGDLGLLTEAQARDALPSLDIAVGDGHDLSHIELEVLPGGELH